MARPQGIPPSSKAHKTKKDLTSDITQKKRKRSAKKAKAAVELGNVRNKDASKPEKGSVIPRAAKIRHFNAAIVRRRSRGCYEAYDKVYKALMRQMLHYAISGLMSTGRVMMTSKDIRFAANLMSHSQFGSVLPDASARKRKEKLRLKKRAEASEFLENEAVEASSSEE